VILMTAAATAVIALALSFATRNRVARGKLRSAAIVAVVALGLAGAMRVPALAAAIPPVVAPLDDLLVFLAIIIAAVALLLNPFLVDRPSARFPNIVQDAVIVVLAFLATTFVLRDTGIVAASAASAVVVGFALQDTLGNAISGLAIQVEKPFHVGNWVSSSGFEGEVVEITWRATKIRTRQDNLVIVPNSEVAKQAITNFSEPAAPTRISFEIGASYHNPPNDVKATIREVLPTGGKAMSPALGSHMGGPAGRSLRLLLNLLSMVHTPLPDR